MTPDKLPEEIMNSIEAAAKKASTVIIWNEFDAGSLSSARIAMGSRVDPIQKEFYIKGATAWAPWKVKYDELKHEIALLKEVNNESLKLTERCQNRYEALQDQAQRMADALEKIRTWNDTEGRSAAWQITHIQNFASDTLQQFKDGKGKEVENEM